MNSNEPRATVELTYAQLLLLTEALNRMRMLAACKTTGQTSALVSETADLVEQALNILDNEHDDNG